MDILAILAVIVISVICLFIIGACMIAHDVDSGFYDKDDKKK